jgi:hypothetical protein
MVLLKKRFKGGSMYLNNGKVKIGSAYFLNPLRPKYVEQDRDMLLIQKHLICDTELFRKRYIATRIFEIFGAFILLIILLKGVS